MKLVVEYDNAQEGPRFNASEVRFNGLGDDGHETFLISRIVHKTAKEDGKVFTFCKTAQKPYDVCVTACLIIFKHHFGDDIDLSSDGGVDGWIPGRLLCMATLGYGNEVRTNDEKEDEEEAEGESGDGLVEGYALKAPSVAARRFCITGTISVNRNVAFDLIKKYGGYVDKSVRFGTDYLVVGTKPGNNKVQGARDHGTKIMSESQFWALFPPAARPQVIVAPGYENVIAVVKGKGYEEEKKILSLLEDDDVPNEPKKSKDKPVTRLLDI